MSRQAPVWLDTQPELAQWYSSGLGQSMVEQLQRQLASSLSDVFGYQGLQIGNPVEGENLLGGAGLHRRLVLDAPGRVADIHADVLHLPIAADTQKLVLFWHTLDFCHQPHQALREADRVLMDDGQLVIVGFNPWSLFGVRHLGSGWRGRVPWSGRFYPRLRVIDWLSVLDYRVLSSEAMFIRPPVNSPGMLQRLQQLEALQPWLGGIGGIYVVRARKHTLPMTLASSHWRRKRAGMAVGGLARSGEARTRAMSRWGADPIVEPKP